MKKNVRLLLALVILLLCSAASLYAKSLVVYYSLTGTTACLASGIAKETDSDIFELKLINPYSTDGNKCSDESKADKADNVQRQLKAVPDLSQYDTVFIGSPVWSNDIANPVETWLLQNQRFLSSKTVIPFCTYWSTGNKEVLSKIAQLSTSKNIKEGISQAHGQNADVKEWIKRIF